MVRGALGAKLVDLNDLGGTGVSLGKGTQGEVFALDDYPDLVYKAYLPKALGRLDSSALDALIEIGGHASGPAGCATLPVARVTAGTNTVGVVLPRIPAQFVARLTTGTSKPREIQFACHPTHARSAGVETPTAAQRAQVLSATATVLHSLHELGLAHSDLSWKNLLWSLDAPYAYLLDCDSARLGGRRSPLPAVSTPGWAEPFIEQGRHEPDIASDVYAFALLFCRVYYQRGGVALSAAHDRLHLPPHPPLSTTVADCLKWSLGRDRAARPSGRDWAHALDELRTIVTDLPLGPPQPVAAPKGPTAPPPVDARSKPAKAAPTSPSVTAASTATPAKRGFWKRLFRRS